MTSATATGSSRRAWQPLTPRGVAAFASASNARACLVSMVVGLLVGGCLVHFVRDAWYPVLLAAISKLPAKGEIRAGQLEWPTNTVVTLADSTFLAVLVNPSGAPTLGRGADLQVEFRPGALEVSWLLGGVAWPYPTRGRVALNQPELEPLWGAWRPHVTVLAPLAIFFLLLVMWMSVAAGLTLPVWLYARLLGRQVSWGGGWRLALMALMPGVLLMGLALVLYTGRRLTLVELLLATVAHLVVGLSYLALAPLHLPRAGEPAPTLASG